MQPTLEKADDERMTCDSSAQVIGERLCEILAGMRTERLARAKPDEGVRLETLAKGSQEWAEGVRVREAPAIEAFAMNQRSPPLAVAPELNFADGSNAFPRRKKAESIRPALRSERRVDPPESTVEMRARLPGKAQGPR